MINGFFFRSLSNTSSRNTVAGKLKRFIEIRLYKNYKKTSLYQLPIHKFQIFALMLVMPLGLYRRSYDVELKFSVSSASL